MTCLSSCDKFIYNHVICPVSSNGYLYTPRQDITCVRNDLSVIFSDNCEICKTAVDCCANNYEECCERGSTSIPTSFPTAQPTLQCGSEEIFYYESSEMCNFFETINENEAINRDNYMTCCSEDREKCCILKSTEIFIGLGCLGTCILIWIYLLVRPSYVSVTPLQKNEKFRSWTHTLYFLKKELPV